MVKTSKKQKTVEYESRDIVCDLCEAEVPAGQAIITLAPFIAREQGDRFGGVEDHKIDICSVDCMVKNAGAAGLLLNTKILPDLRTREGAKSRRSSKATKEFIDMMMDDEVLKKAATKERYSSPWKATYNEFDKYAAQVK